MPMASQPCKRARFTTDEVVTFLDDDDNLDLMREVICEGSDDEFEWNEDELDDYEE